MPHRVKGIAGLATALTLALAATAAARDSRVADAAEQRAATAVSALLTEGADVNGRLSPTVRRRCTGPSIGTTLRWREPCSAPGPIPMRSTSTG